MKQCSVCKKSAVYHVTVLQDGEVRELHFCEHHFHEYMTPSSKEVTTTEAEEESMFAGTSLEEETDDENDLKCPNCGLTFRQFREQGRFGCPQDYDVFREKLMPLLENIHNETLHCGKVPKRAPNESQFHYKLIRLRKDLANAVKREKYEEAAAIRDEIQSLEAQIEH